MAKDFNTNTLFVEQAPDTIEKGDGGKNLDDDGRYKRTGTYPYILRFILSVGHH